MDVSLLSLKIVEGSVYILLFKLSKSMYSAGRIQLHARSMGLFDQTHKAITSNQLGLNAGTVCVGRGGYIKVNKCMSPRLIEMGSVIQLFPHQTLRKCTAHKKMYYLSESDTDSKPPVINTLLNVVSNIDITTQGRSCRQTCM